MTGFLVCALYTFLVNRLENVVFLCTVHTCDVPSGKCVSVHSTHFWWTVCKLLRFCAQCTFLTYRLEIVVFLCSVYISYVPSGKCCVSLHSTHFKVPTERVLCLFTVHNSDVPTENILFLCTVHISDVPSRKYCVSLHRTHFWCTVWKLIFFCAQYTFLM